MSAGKVIGITGFTGSGKTVLADIIRGQGLYVIDVDRFAHGLYEKGRPVYRRIVKKYGEEVLGKDGFIDRKKLGKKVFVSEKEYRDFSGIIFPPLVKALEKEISLLKEKFVFLDMAVLFESGFYKKTDEIITVCVSDEVREKREKKSGKAGLRKRIYEMQKIFPFSKKIALSTYILYNDENIERLKKQALKILKMIGVLYA
ncbi:MAG: dephospho-CoA kinase [Candidatus Goldiibacteriota bacterium]